MAKYSLNGMGGERVNLDNYYHPRMQVVMHSVTSVSLSVCVRHV